MYLTRTAVTNALNSMRNFNCDLSQVFRKYDMSIEDNTGRRNALLSQAQEHFFSVELRKSYPSVVNDGRTGKPDIEIPELNVELECKLTTPSSSGGVTFQADKECFGESGKDFLYVIADNKFENFAALHFKSLQRRDFSDCVESSKGKVRMRKDLTHDRCTVLHGEYEPRSKKMLAKINGELTTKRKGTKAYEKLLERKAHWEGVNESFTVRLSPP